MIRGVYKTICKTICIDIYPSLTTSRSLNTMICSKALKSADKKLEDVKDLDLSNFPCLGYVVVWRNYIGGYLNIGQVHMKFLKSWTVDVDQLNPPAYKLALAQNMIKILTEFSSWLQGVKAWRRPWKWSWTRPLLQSRSTGLAWRISIWRRPAESSQSFSSKCRKFAMWLDIIKHYPHGSP